ncbi:MAG: hypothetical protein ACI90V_012923, partial [Bacillariaceae sp.]
CITVGYLLYVQYFIFQGVFLSHAQRGNKTLSEPIMHDNNPRHFIFLISNHRISVIIDFYDNTDSKHTSTQNYHQLYYYCMLQ